MAFQVSNLLLVLRSPKALGWYPALETDVRVISVSSADLHIAPLMLCCAGTGSESINVLPCPPRGSYVKQTGGRRFPWPQSPFSGRMEGLLTPARVVVGAVGVSGAVLASLSTGTSTRPELNLDSESSDWKEAKKKLCSMDKEKRREMYRIDFIPLQKISVWSPSVTPLVSLGTKSVKS